MGLSETGAMIALDKQPSRKLREGCLSLFEESSGAIACAS